MIGYHKYKHIISTTLQSTNIAIYSYGTGPCMPCVDHCSIANYVNLLEGITMYHLDMKFLFFSAWYWDSWLLQLSKKPIVPSCHTVMQVAIPWAHFETVVLCSKKTFNFGRGQAICIARYNPYHP